MKKITAIIGSPRKGETYKELKRIENDIKKYDKSDDYEFDYVFLREIGIEDCLGCHLCIEKGESFCFQSEKITELKNKMVQSDLIILASPVYNDHVTSLMKKFFDYLTYLWHRPEMFGRKFFGISSGGGMFKNTFSYMKKNILNWGGEWLGQLGIPHYDSLTPKYAEKSDLNRQKSIKIIVNSVNKTGLKSPSLGRLIYFNIWKINAQACRKSIPADFEYWKQKKLFEADYYYPVKICPFKKLIASIMKRMIHSFMKKVYKGY